jgi:hypothetical protein
LQRHVIGKRLGAENPQVYGGFSVNRRANAVKFPFEASLDWEGVPISQVRVIGETPKCYRIEALQRTRIPRGRFLAQGCTTLVPKKAIKEARQGPPTIEWTDYTEGPGEAIHTFVDGVDGDRLELVAWTMRVLGKAEHGLEIWTGKDFLTRVYQIDQLESREYGQQFGLELAKVRRSDWPKVCRGNGSGG